MVAGLDSWVVGEPNLHEERLEARLHVSGFVLPPSANQNRDVPIVRFPRFHSCKACNRLTDRRSLLADGHCECGGELVPSRFVVCCPRGHIDEFPYFWWVHKDGKGNSPCRLSLETKGSSASLSSVEVSCSCGAKRSMEGAFGKMAMPKCSGRRPWITEEKEECAERQRALQRGASNVWFSSVASSLSIPPYSSGIWEIIEKHWDSLRAMPDEGTMRIVISQYPSVQSSGLPIDDFVKVAMQRQRGEMGSASGGLRADEYRALCTGFPQQSERDRFVCIAAKERTGAVADFFSQIMLVNRLREVRALCGFTRLMPFAPGAEQVNTAPLSKGHIDWRPAIEVNGEGVFFRLEEEKLRKWEVKAEVIDRTERIARNYARVIADLGSKTTLTITPRLLLLHTFAHMLIQQWSLECGYPAASLRERLYVTGTGEDADMAGVLIYTATGDSAGSLGGIVAQAAPRKLESAFREALGRSAWCSADPLCIEADAQGVNSLNLAACHACALLPEVSCEYFNMFLDRGMLVGWPDYPKSGFFFELLGE